MNVCTKSFSVSINPTYKCSSGCKFCYLGDQRTNATLLPIQKLHATLSKFSSINSIDIYGGEISELTDDYILDLLDCVKQYSPESINITTNLSRICSSFLEPDVDLYVSWDYICRPNFREALKNLKALNRPYSIITLGTTGLANDILLKNYVEILNSLDNLISVEIKPYSPSKDNNKYGTEEDFEKIVKYLIEYPDKRFGLVNEDLMNIALGGERPYLYNHVFINPYGEYTVLDFDENGLEYFRMIKDIDEVKSRKVDDIVRMSQNPECQKCKYNQSCLSEHINYNTCTGHKNLLEWYERMEI